MSVNAALARLLKDRSLKKPFTLSTLSPMPPLSGYQRKALFRSTIVGIIWWLFIAFGVQLHRSTGLLGCFTSICTGLWIGWNQSGMGLASSTGVILTTLSFLFSAIPTYDKTPNLDTFSLGQLPYIACSPENSGAILIQNTTTSRQTICARPRYPFLAGQTISILSGQDSIVSLGNGTSAYAIGPATFTLQRTATGYSLKETQGSINYYPPRSGQITLFPHNTQYTIAQNYRTEKQEYLQKKFGRERETSPLITTIAIRKMRLIGLIDRSYQKKVTHLQWYLTQRKE